MRTHPDGNSSTNQVVLSWRGGAAYTTESGVNAYLDKMNALETDYSAVKFIYMTGHLVGSEINGNLFARNDQIRGYCLANGKTLFDFAYVESYDPDWVFYPDDSNVCN